MNNNEEYADLVLASEDFSGTDFKKYHCFYKYEESIISQLMAHGPVLLKGGRGTGKSALMREANSRLQANENVCGIYLSLRHLNLLRSSGVEYEKVFLQILKDEIKKQAQEKYSFNFECSLNVYEMHKEIIRFSEYINKRIVLYFDDAAHIGRETGLEEFFDIFRTLSSNVVSCKAAIYPGVTRFGTRFDIYNDAKVIDISRHFGQTQFKEFFCEVMKLRFSNQISSIKFSNDMTLEDVSSFLGTAVLGNVRSFIKGCSMLFEAGEKVTLTSLNEILLALSSNFFWPMMEEIKYKIGVYEPLMDPCMQLADAIYTECGEKRATSFIIHRNLVNKYSKCFEILEYAGFIAKREASRGMKQGGRGTRYNINLCNVLEKVPGTRLTKDLYNDWRNPKVEDIQFAANSMVFNDIILPEGEKNDSLGIGILDLDIDKLKKSAIFPYGLTDDKIIRLKGNGYDTVGQLAAATYEDLSAIDRIGDGTINRIRNVVEQAIWM
jgi:hypothetical protein